MPKCPACKTTVERVWLKTLHADGEMRSHIKCFALCCQQCGTILGMQLDPKEEQTWDQLKRD
jgi:hypothetical protein